MANYRTPVLAEVRLTYAELLVGAFGVASSAFGYFWEIVPLAFFGLLLGVFAFALVVARSLLRGFPAVQEHLEIHAKYGAVNTKTRRGTAGCPSFHDDEVNALLAAACGFEAPFDVARKALQSPSVNTQGAKAGVDPSAIRTVKRSSTVQVRHCARRTCEDVICGWSRGASRFPQSATALDHRPERRRPGKVDSQD
jgi:hypothetical protein